jgi:hypothetical protein
MALLNYDGGSGACPPTAPEPSKPCVRRRQDRSHSLRLKICRDRSGTWSVHGLSPLPVEHLPSLSASFDYARRECAAAPATIELVIDGFYAVVHQKDGWPRPPVVLKGKRSLVEDRGSVATGDHDIASVARSRPSWFSEWRACVMRFIATLVSGVVATKRSKSAFSYARASQPRSSV